MRYHIFGMGVLWRLPLAVMKEFEDLKKRYADYLAFCGELPKKYSRAAGLLGVGAGPKDDPGHEAFFDEAKVLADALAAAAPTPDVAREAVDFMLKAEFKNEDDELARWMLLAAQAHAIPIIPFLDSGDALELLSWYDAHYPRRMRFPSQKEVYKALIRATR